MLSYIGLWVRSWAFFIFWPHFTKVPRLATIRAMIDIAKQHRKSGSEKILAKFFTSKAYRDIYWVLRERGFMAHHISKRRKAYRGSPGVALVHPMVALEYARWVDYAKYIDWASEHLSL